MFFENIYRWFISSDLAEHLKGWDQAASDYIKTNLFWWVDIATLVIVLLACITYYYFLDHPRQNRWWKWLVVWLLPVAFLNFLIAFGISFNDVIAENISPDLVISWLHCLGFGLTNFVISALFFLIISFVIKLLSKFNIYPSINCEHSPFKF
jgi:hypothetical protein